MEQQINPYESGQAIQQGHNDPSANMPVTPVALASLVGTKFWVSLVGVTMLIIIAINIIGMVFVGSNVPSGAPAGFLLVWILPLAMMVVQVVLAVRLVQYGKAIGRLQGSANDLDLERAMEVYTKFWKLAGISIIVMFGITLLGMIVGIAAA